jgi:hypothetical protein
MLGGVPEPRRRGSGGAPKGVAAVERGWRTERPGHVTISVSLDEVPGHERTWAIGQLVSLYADDRVDGWVRVTDLRRTAERRGQVVYLLADVTCDPPPPPT